MKTKLLISGLIISLFAIHSERVPKFQNDSGHKEISEIGAESIGLKEWQQKRLADPKTGKIPENIRARELKFAQNLPTTNALYKKTGLIWESRGPVNVGGRTRAVAFDVENENVILAGGVSGGIWRSIDGGASWVKMTEAATMQSVTCLVQDKRKGKTNIWYYGTGEFYGNSANIPGDGIFKSTDNGQTWKSLNSLNKPQDTRDFNYCWRIVTDHTRMDSDIVYVATYGGIQRSNDGGKTWTTALKGSGTSPARFTDVVITQGGVLYAALADPAPTAPQGIWRSTDGIKWIQINPANWPNSGYRTVIGLAPSNKNVVYFLSNTNKVGKKSKNVTSLGEKQEWHQLYKYTYKSGDGSGDNGTWEDRSANLPNYLTDDNLKWGDFVSQNGYDLIISVKPDDEDYLIIGGTNLYKSSDGFSSMDSMAWIGGYRNNIKDTFDFLRGAYYGYPNHHPDQHGAIFYPSDPSKLLSFNDGGFALTKDITADNVVWESLNNGYQTTQFYTIFLNHNPDQDLAMSDILMGGLQDNNMLWTHLADDPKSDWKRMSFGDGSYGAIVDINNNTYVLSSSQLGRIYLNVFDDAGKNLGKARIDPAGASDYIFINPFILNPNNPKQLILPSSSQIWINSDITKFPLNEGNDKKTINWQQLNKIFTNEISALAISKNPANILYYGNSGGSVLKYDDITNLNKTPAFISLGKLGGTGYVSCIAIDPADAKRVFVTFSNYNRRSIYYTKDGGDNWEDISGNLEENPDGTGSGPSVRWLTICPIANDTVYMVGTSVGLFSTYAIEGDKTIWSQESPDLIGNTVVDMIDFRQTDGVLAVATHGYGVFTTNLQLVSSMKENLSKSITFESYPNPSSDKITFSLYLKEPSEVRLDIFDINGRLVRNVTRHTFTTGKHDLETNVSALHKGLYISRMKINNQVYSRKLEVK